MWSLREQGACRNNGPHQSVRRTHNRAALRFFSACEPFASPSIMRFYIASFYCNGKTAARFFPGGGRVPVFYPLIGPDERVNFVLFGATGVSGFFSFCLGGRVARSPKFCEVKHIGLDFCSPQRPGTDTLAISESPAGRTQFLQKLVSAPCRDSRIPAALLPARIPAFFLPGTTKGAARFMRGTPTRSAPLHKTVPPRWVSFACGLSLLFQFRQIVTP